MFEYSTPFIVCPFSNPNVLILFVLGSYITARPVPSSVWNFVSQFGLLVCCCSQSAVSEMVSDPYPGKIPLWKTYSPSFVL